MPSLPHLDKAIVNREKLENYLLNVGHPEGRGKALLFARVGYARSNWSELRDALLEHARLHEAEPLEPNAYGAKFLIAGALRVPEGRPLRIRAIWFVANGTDIPIFVTAYPERQEQI